MARGSLRLVEYLAAGLFLAAFALSPVAFARHRGGGGSGGALDANACEAPDIATAIKGCTEIIDNGRGRNAKFVEAYLSRGKAYAKRGNFAEAIADFEEAIRLNPANGELYRERGDSHRARREFATAEEDLTTAIHLDPSDAKAYTLLGWLYKQNGGNERAKSSFERALKLANEAIAAKVDVALARYYRAEALAGLGDYDKAIASYDAAIKAKPEDETAYADRGVIYSIKGDKDRALADFNKALDLQPDYWHATERTRKPVYPDRGVRKGGFRIRFCDHS